MVVVFIVLLFLGMLMVIGDLLVTNSQSHRYLRFGLRLETAVVALLALHAIAALIFVAYVAMQPEWPPDEAGQSVSNAPGP